jgi:hypothetical protein
VDSNAALNSKVSALEDEMRIVKGEVKQVLTEIRSAILVMDNPFEENGPRPRAVQVVPALPDEPVRIEPAAPAHAAPHEAPPTLLHAVPPSHPDAHIQPQPHVEAAAAAERPRPLAAAVAPPRWSLLTVASLAAWAEEALQRLGAQRLAILLDLCETAGYLTPEARQALGRVAELDLPAPPERAAPLEVTVLLRQLDALLQGDQRDAGVRALY